MVSISHLPASQWSFEKDNRKILISEIRILDAKKKNRLIFACVFSLVDGIFWHFGNFAKKSNKKSNPIFPILSDFFRLLDFSRLLDF